MGRQLVVQRLREADWEQLEGVTGETPEEAVAQVAAGPGIYRSRQAGSDDPWRFLYVDEDGRVIDSGAISRL